MTNLFNHTPVEAAKVGDIVTNGIYEIRLSEEPRISEDGRWSAKGNRWLPSSATWQAEKKTFGGVVR